jgi:hypothetical protein
MGRIVPDLVNLQNSQEGIAGPPTFARKLGEASERFSKTVLRKRELGLGSWGKGIGSWDLGAGGWRMASGGWGWES